MDRLDLAILAEFARQPRATYGEVGAGVGLSGNAVKSRVQRLEATGVLEGFIALPEPRVLGASEGLLVFSGIEDVDEREEEVLRSLPDVPGVTSVDVAIDHAVYVWTLHTDASDWDRIERAAISLVGKPPAHRFEGASADFSSAPAFDSRVARALLTNARASSKELAAKSGLSFKTLKRRLDALLTSASVRVEPVLSGTAASGAVLSRLVIVLKDPTLLPPLPADALVTRFAGSRLVALDLRHATLRESQEVSRSLRGEPAVERCFFQIATRRRFAAWLDEALAARAAPHRALPAAPLMPVPRTRG